MLISKNTCEMHWGTVRSVPCVERLPGSCSVSLHLLIECFSSVFNFWVRLCSHEGWLCPSWKNAATVLQLVRPVVVVETRSECEVVRVLCAVSVCSQVRSFQHQLLSYLSVWQFISYWERTNRVPSEQCTGHPSLPTLPRACAAAPILFPFLFLLSYATVEMELPVFILLNGLYLMAIVKPSIFLVHTVLNIEIFHNYFYYFNTAFFLAIRKMSH